MRCIKTIESEKNQEFKPLEEEDYLKFQESRTKIDIKGKNPPSQSFLKLKKNSHHNYNTTRIIFTLIAVTLSLLIIFMLIYYIPYFYYGWRFLSQSFSKYKSWSFFPGL